MCCKLRLEVGQGKPSLCGCLEVCCKPLGVVCGLRGRAWGCFLLGFPLINRALYGFRVWFSYKLDQSSSIYKKGMLLANS
jgi:hypothetical protein